MRFVATHYSISSSRLVFALGWLLCAFVPPSGAAEPNATWRAIGKSIEGRPIEIAEFGSGARTYLVIGPLDGSGRDASALVAQLAEYLSQPGASLTGKHITVLRDPNPDGSSRSRLANARGVDLDWNFATPDWQQVTAQNRWVSGRGAASEPETRAIAAVVTTLRPARIVHVRTSRATASTRHAPSAALAVSAAGPSEQTASRISAETRLPLWPTDPSVHAGSLARFAAIDNHLPILTLWAGHDERSTANRERLFRALLMALDLDPPANPVASSAPIPPVVEAPAAPTGSASVQVLSVERLLQGAPLAPVVTRRAASRDKPVPAVTVSNAAPASVPVAVAKPPVTVQPAAVTEKTKRPAPPSTREPEKPIPVPWDEELK